LGKDNFDNSTVWININYCYQLFNSIQIYMKNHFIFLLLLVLSGCYSSKKAIIQVDKALSVYPEIVAKQIRDRFPCIPDTITKKIDSSEYKEWKKQLDETISFYDSLLNNVEPQIIFEKDLSDSMKINILLANNEKLLIKLSLLEKSISIIRNTKIPVIHDTIPVRDSADVYLANLETVKERAKSEKLILEKSKLENKIKNKNKELWIWRAIAFALIAWQVVRIWKSLTTIKIKS